VPTVNPVAKESTPTSDRGNTDSMRAVRPSGFTLIELLVVVLLLAIVMGLVGVNLSRDETAKIRDEAARLALALQAGRQEAILQGQIIVLLVSTEGYEFMTPDDTGKLIPLPADNVLAVRAWSSGISLVSVQIEGANEEEKFTGILLDPSGNLQAFTITLATGKIRWLVEGKANGKIISTAPPPSKAA
jgi:general secretion pathway protein H